MKRFSKAVALTVATGALVLGSATTALAYDGGGKGGGKGYGKSYGKSYGKGYGKGYGFDGYGYGNRRSGANARAIAVGSPGILSGNVIQVPINVPINVCGNGLNAIGLLNPTAGNVCING
ncbi:chaplin [Actinacidiphila glaucinigra]|uniref:chaplin n=1 Tax=Actinacidiphila glaucinigra TaxID=235986 RepID=UPI002DD897F9|nr:chaplin [Actinacidiphila glaucinigra]WSD62242.1 chaplin [Actinacidiphila glaucinigra]